jgi:hypothetical protein
MINERKGKVWIDSSRKVRFWHPNEGFQLKQALAAWVKAEGHMKVRFAL